MVIENLGNIVSIVIAIISVIIAYSSFKKSEKQEMKKEGKNEGLLLSDMGYIKACVERVDKSINKMDETYKDMLQRLTKLEESVVNVNKRVDEFYSSERENL